MNAPRLSRSFLLVLCAGLLIMPASRASGRSPDLLELVPSDATAVGVIHLTDLRTSPLAPTFLDETDRVAKHGEAEHFLEESGIKPGKDVDTIVFSLRSSGKIGDADAEVLIALEGRFQVKILGSALLSRGCKLQTNPKGAYYLLPEKNVSFDKEKGHPGGVMAIVDSHLILLGSESAVVSALARRSAGGSSGFSVGQGIGRELHRVKQDATAWVLVDTSKQEQLQQTAGLQEHPKHGDDSPVSGMVSAMKNIQLLVVEAGIQKEDLMFSLTGLTSDEPTRDLMEDTLHGMMAIWRLAVNEKSPEMLPVLRKFTIVKDEAGVSISGAIPMELLNKMIDERCKNHTKT